MNKFFPAFHLAGPLVAAGYAFYLGGYYWLLLLMVPWSAWYWRRRAKQIEATLRYQIEQVTGPTANLLVFPLTFPGFQFVDLFEAANLIAENSPGAVGIQSDQPESLAGLLRSEFYDLSHQNIRRPQYLTWKTGPGREQFYPATYIWAAPAPEVDEQPSKPEDPEAEDESAPGPFVLRLRFDGESGDALLEIAAGGEEEAFVLKKQVEILARTNSIYRGNIIRPGYDRELDDNYGETAAVNSGMKINFVQGDPVTARDIVLEDRIETILENNIFGFLANNTLNEKLGFQQNKGFLLFGPPGTGKTWCCRYIAGSLDNVTTIVAAGEEMAFIKSVSNLARTLQPAIVILEDVDLFFSDRNLNPFNATLGELLDQLDGFHRDDQVVFLLTTNALERIEPAIRNRPGRVNQIIHFSPPDKEQRLRLLNHFFDRKRGQGNDYTFPDREKTLTELAERLNGATPAFLKEITERVFQVALRREITSSTPSQVEVWRDPANPALPQLEISGGLFDKALDEILEFNPEAAYSILGYQRDIL